MQSNTTHWQPYFLIRRGDPPLYAGLGMWVVREGKKMLTGFLRFARVEQGLVRTAAVAWG